MKTVEELKQEYMDAEVAAWDAYDAAFAAATDEGAWDVFAAAEVDNTYADIYAAAAYDFASYRDARAASDAAYDVWQEALKKEEES